MYEVGSAVFDNFVALSFKGALHQNLVLEL